MHTLADRVRWARNEAGITQQQAADFLGVNKFTVCDIENGRIKTTTYIPHFAELYDVSAYWLATGEGQPRGGLPREIYMHVRALPKYKQKKLLTLIKQMIQK